MPRILIVDDDTHIAESLRERFAAKGFYTGIASDGLEALEQIRENDPDIVLLDLQMPKMDGFGVLAKLQEEGIDSTVIVITAFGNIEKAVDAMKAGAYDFIQKPFEPALLDETVRRALERQKMKRALTASTPDFVVVDPKMKAPVDLARKAAASDATVLLLGESGSGKEVISRAIHQWSPRNSGPFVAVNAVALSESLLESELFGHEKGAFTGAIDRKTGKLEVASGGTLFLDEIGDISASFQAKLLRVLQEKSFERVGGTETIQADIRFIAATNCNLKKKVEEGTFREDLYYRLNVIAITLPPLRERPADLRALAEHFLKEFKPAARFAEEALQVIDSYRWPGNVRELRNAIERAAVLLEGNEVGADDFPAEILLSKETSIPTGGFHEQVDQHRKQIVVEALDRAEGNQTRAAELLGLQRTYLARLIRQMGIQVPKKK